MPNFKIYNNNIKSNIFWLTAVLGTSIYKNVIEYIKKIDHR